MAFDPCESDGAIAEHRIICMRRHEAHYSVTGDAAWGILGWNKCPKGFSYCLSRSLVSGTVNVCASTISQFKMELIRSAQAAKQGESVINSLNNAIRSADG